ncbi:MAG TPA: FixH family protein [Ktedonobacterales bacterium]|nr:FixH family protein [Ktedonobacterales bacterium]
MSIQSRENKIDDQQDAADAPGERLASQGVSRPAPSVARIRRRAIIISLGILLFLLFVGLGDALGGFLPHTTAPFANGRTQTAGDFQVTLQFTPNPPKYSADPTTLAQITIQGHAGQSLDGVVVQLGLTMVTMDMGANETQAQGVGDGRYQARVAFLMPGAWQVTVTVEPPSASSASTTFDVDVAN